MHPAKWILLLLFALSVMTHAQVPSEANLMPMPSSVQFGPGRLPIDQSFSIQISGRTEPRLQRAAARMLETLSLETGIPFGSVPADPNRRLVVRCEKESAAIQQVGEDESYRLSANPSGAEIEAQTSLGALRGLQTFLQLVELTSEGFGIREVKIEDHPRFPWRGLMIDVSRHFQPIEVLKRNLDAMEAVKLNVLHWHLSDNQGFRVESRKFPKLQQIASEGQYYTQAEIKDLIEYARDRGIRIVPEFDIPGHCTAWLAAYPELASQPGPYQVEHAAGIFDPAMDPTKEEVYKYLDRFIAEMAGLFPDAYFHIGGDEVNGKQWDTNPKIQEFKRSRQLADNRALQAYFNKRVQALVTKHHKKMIGWEEILQPDLPRDTVIHAWLGPQTVARAVKQGYQGIVSYGYYLDLSQSARFHYSIDPVGLSGPLSPEEEKLVLGGEACMWTEMVPPALIDSRIWPRMAAIAERFWSPQGTKDVASMYRRMEAESFRLEWLPTRLSQRSSYLPGLRRLSGGVDEESLQVLADTVEPVKQYEREEQHKKAFGKHYVQSDAFNRLVDVVRPDSIVKVRFDEMVEHLLAGKAGVREQAELRSLLAGWAANDALLQPAIARSALLKEVAPLSAALAATGNSGLQALEYFQNGSRPSPKWIEEQLDMLSKAEKPQAELFLPIVPGIKRMMEALRTPPGS